VLQQRFSVLVWIKADGEGCQQSLGL